MLNKNRVSLPIRGKTYSQLLIIFLFILTFLFIFFSKTDYFIANKVKSIGIDYESPITKIISSPITLLNDAITRINNIQRLELSNLKLQEEIIRLKKWQILAIKNSRENKVFKRLLNSTSHQVDIIKTASVVSQAPGIYLNLITLNAGKNHNLRINLSVINHT